MCDWHLNPTQPRPSDYDGCQPNVVGGSVAVSGVALAVVAVVAWSLPSIAISRHHPVVVPVFGAFLLAVVLVLMRVLVGLSRDANAETVGRALVLDKLGALLVTVVGEKGYTLTDDQIDGLLRRVALWWSLPAAVDDAWLAASVARILNAEADRIGVAPTATPTAVRALALGAVA
jgi:hypothetical protein